jgi:glycosyltransferase involved in cell wall biosynthesis
MSERQPDVTVVIPTRDRPAFLARAIVSALGQTFDDLEVLVVEDGSEVPFVPKGDARVRVIRSDRSRGVCEARNRGLAEARGRWITFLDDDDELLPDMVEVSRKEAAASSLPTPVAVLSGVHVVDQDGHAVEDWYAVSQPRGARYFLEPAGPNGRYRSERSLFAPTTVMRAIGGWDASLPASEDKDLFLRLNAICSLQAVPRLLYRKTIHRGVKLTSDPLAFAVGLSRTIEKHRTLLRSYPHRYAHLLGSMAMYDLRAGRWRSAVAATSRAVLMEPLRGERYAQLIVALAGPRAFAAASAIRRRRRP